MSDRSLLGGLRCQKCKKEALEFYKEPFIRKWVCEECYLKLDDSQENLGGGE